MDQTGDTARVILQDCEGYTVDEMAEMMKEDNIIRKVRSTRNESDLPISTSWLKAEIRIAEGQMKKLDDFAINLALTVK